MSNNQPENITYRVLFKGCLRQETAFSSGGNTPQHTLVDNPLCRDGKGRFIIKGTALAGALAATARKIYGTALPDRICRHAKDPEAPTPTPSCWLTRNIHIGGVANQNNGAVANGNFGAFRQGVSIELETGAKKDSALFDVETLPPGTQWNFWLEVDARRDADNLALYLAAQALAAWQDGLCFLGRDVARGLGWFKLEDLQVLVLGSEDALIWPNALLKDISAAEDADWLGLEALFKDRVGEVSGLDEFVQALPPPAQAIKSQKCYSRMRFTIAAGESDDGYGLDGLSIGGHAQDLLASKWLDGHYIAPYQPDGDGVVDAEKMQKLYDPDHQLAMIKMAEGDDYQPYIPGSSVRGVLRHGVQRHTDSTADDINRLFGTVEKSAALLVSDAYLHECPDWQAAWLQQHAEDEFTAGTYKSAKFDRMAVLQGCFTGYLLLEADDEPALELYKKELEAVFKLAKSGHLPLGGNQWRGLGWVSWLFDEWQDGHYAVPLPQEAGDDKSA